MHIIERPHCEGAREKMNLAEIIRYRAVFPKSHQENTCCANMSFCLKRNSQSRAFDRRSNCAILRKKVFLHLLPEIRAIFVHAKCVKNICFRLRLTDKYRNYKTFPFSIEIWTLNFDEFLENQSILSIRCSLKFNRLIAFSMIHPFCNFDYHFLWKSFKQSWILVVSFSFD